MTLNKMIIHEIHENTRTKPGNFFSMEFDLMGGLLNECIPLLFFAPFVFFVDEILKGSL